MPNSSNNVLTSITHSSSDKKVVFVTGGSRGIGQGICLALAREGFSIAINYNSNKEAAEETARNCESFGVQSCIVQGDVGDTSIHEKMIQDILERMGRIDVLVNNAGVAPKQRMDLLDASEESFDRVLGTNLRGPYFLTQKVSRYFLAQLKKEPGSMPMIINVSSVSAFTSSPARGEYCLSKAGVAMMTKLFADRLAEDGIRVYEIQPGVIKTDMTSVVTDKYDKMIAEGLTPIKRWGLPSDIGQAVLALCKGYFPFSTGEVFHVDGGFHLRRL